MQDSEFLQFFKKEAVRNKKTFIQMWLKLEKINDFENTWTEFEPGFICSKCLIECDTTRMKLSKPELRSCELCLHSCFKDKFYFVPYIEYLLPDFILQDKEMQYEKEKEYLYYELEDALYQRQILVGDVDEKIAYLRERKDDLEDSYQKKNS